MFAAEHDAGDHRQERDAGDQRREAEDLLHDVGQEQRHAEHAGGEHEDRQERPAAEAVEHDPQRQQRGLDPALDEHEGDEQHDAGGEEGVDQRRGPAVGLGAREAVDHAEQPGRGEHRAHDVEVRAVLDGLRREQQRGADERDRREDRVDVHAPAPVDVLGQRAAEQQPDRGAGAGERGEHPEGARALASLGERRRQQREGGRGEQRAEHALQGARRHQQLEAGREPAEDRRHGEADQADEEGALAAEEVREAAAQQQQAAERQRVGGDDPLALRVVEAEVGLRRGQGDVHDRVVEDDHQLGDPDHGEDQPASPGGWCFGRVLTWRTTVLGDSVGGSTESGTAMSLAADAVESSAGGPRRFPRGRVNRSAVRWGRLAAWSSRSSA